MPPVLADDATTVREVLVSQRQVAVAAATRLRNQAHQLLLQADPDYRAHLPAVTTPEGITALEGYQPLVLVETAILFASLLLLSNI